MKFNVITKSENYKLDITPKNVYIIGYSGSNQEKIMVHIRELEEQLNVAPPKKIPTIFEVSREIVTQNKDLSFVSEKTCGECEYIILIKDKKIYIGLGSDHSDRDLESVSVTKAKQVCLKPISTDFWEYEEIKEHFSEIKLISKYDSKIYQQGSLADILSVEQLLKELNSSVGEIGDTIIFSGTVPLVDGYVYGYNFEMELIDEKLNRKICHQYNVNVISDEAR